MSSIHVLRQRRGFIVFNTIFINISVFLVEETEGPREKSVTCGMSLTNFIT
jgi:hypothetical protein